MLSPQQKNQNGSFLELSLYTKGIFRIHLWGPSEPEVECEGFFQVYSTDFPLPNLKAECISKLLFDVDKTFARDPQSSQENYGLNNLILLKNFLSSFHIFCHFWDFYQFLLNYYHSKDLVSIVIQQYQHILDYWDNIDTKIFFLNEGVDILKSKV